MKQRMIVIVCVASMFANQISISMEKDSYANSCLLVDFFINEHNRLDDDNFLPVAEKMFKMGADVNIEFFDKKSEKKHTPLTVLLQHRQKQLQWDTGKDVITWLIKNKADVNRDLHGGRTPLSIACQQGCPFSVIKELVQAGATINKRLSEKEFLLNVVAQYCHTDVVKYFLDLYKQENEMTIEIKLTPLNEKS